MEGLISRQHHQAPQAVSQSCVCLQAPRCRLGIVPRGLVYFAPLRGAGGSNAS